MDRRKNSRRDDSRRQRQRSPRQRSRRRDSRSPRRRNKSSRGRRSRDDRRGRRGSDTRRGDGDRNNGAASSMMSKASNMSGGPGGSMMGGSASSSTGNNNNNGNRGGGGGNKKRGGKKRDKKGNKKQHQRGNPTFSEGQKLTKFFVTNNDCARILGQKAKIMKEIEADCGGDIMVQNRKDADKTGQEFRYIQIIGLEVQIQRAEEMFLPWVDYFAKEDGSVVKDVRGTDKALGRPQNAAGNGDSDAPRRIRLFLEIKNEEIGRIVGKRGTLIREMEEDTQTKIEIDKSANVVEISGDSKEACEQAQNSILHEVSWCRNRDTGEVLKRDSYPGRGGEQTRYNDDPVVLLILDKEAGRVIGRGGEIIREIMDRSGADVRVEKSEAICGDNDVYQIPNERRVEVFGRNQRMKEYAKELILAEIGFAKDEFGNIIKDDPEFEDRERKRKGLSKGLGKRMPSIGAWVCGYCAGDHRSKDCPAHMQNQTTLQMLQLLGFNMLPSPIPSMKNTGMLAPPGNQSTPAALLGPGMPGFIAPLPPGLYDAPPSTIINAYPAVNPQFMHTGLSDDDGAKRYEESSDDSSDDSSDGSDSDDSDSSDSSDDEKGGGIDENDL